MILRRLAGAFRTQDWFTVLVEIMIVVLGVFVGIQVSNWNETRIQRDRETVMIAALRDDFRAIEDSLLHSVAYHERSIEGLRTIAASLRAGTLGEDERPAFEDGLRYGYLDAASNTASGVLLEALASGELTLLRDPGVRAALSDFESHREAANAAASDIRRYAAQYMRSLTARFDYDPRRTHPSPGADPDRVRPISAIGDYDFQAMLDDEEFREAVDELHELQTLWLNWSHRTLDRVQRVRTMLDDPSTETESSS